jgi:hypothetical protein
LLPKQNAAKKTGLENFIQQAIPTAFARRGGQAEQAKGTKIGVICRLPRRSLCAKAGVSRAEKAAQ